MRIAVLGTGDVGRALATAFAKAGHDVGLGSRTSGNAVAVEWAAGAPGVASQGSFAEVAAAAEVVVLAVSGLNALDALDGAGSANLAGKVLVDATNPMDLSGGFPPKVVVPAEGSVGAAIQARFPEAKVVKTLNTVNNAVMVEPGLVPGHHNLFLSGDDTGAKETVAGLLGDLGWRREQLIDLGGIASARGPEQMLPMWCELFGALPGKAFNIAVVTS